MFYNNSFKECFKKVEYLEILCGSILYLSNNLRLVCALLTKAPSSLKTIFNELKEYKKKSVHCLSYDTLVKSVALETVLFQFLCRVIVVDFCQIMSIILKWFLLILRFPSNSKIVWHGWIVFLVKLKLCYVIVIRKLCLTGIQTVTPFSFLTKH